VTAIEGQWVDRTDYHTVTDIRLQNADAVKRLGESWLLRGNYEVGRLTGVIKRGT
jgi:hypothetical protein